jgi:uracil-DNA glycosylase
MTVTPQIEEKLRLQMGSWYPVLVEFIKTPEWDMIITELKKSTAAGKRVAPISDELWEAFRQCPRQEFKMLHLGYCPYHTFRDGKPIADGVMFSNSHNGQYDQQSPSLQAFYDGMEEDLGFNPANPRRNSLEYISKQGVLMLNSQLTVEEGKAGIHMFWDTFMKWFIQKVMNEGTRGIVCVFYGIQAAKYEKMINPMQHYTKVVEHPAAQAYRSGSVTWKHDKLFTWCSDILWQNNKYIMDWTDNGLDGLPF